MKRIGWACALLLGMHSVAYSRGVSPYLPLNLEPEMESQIERVMILANMPVMKRPIAAANVLDALAKANKVDPVLCERVRRYLARYTHTAGITHASVEGAASSGKGSSTVAPNSYGMTENSHWNASAQVYWQPGDHILVDAGAVAYEGHTDYTGSLISLGWNFAQLDIGFRPHWFSPLTDSSLLMSTEAPTLPSVTLSNYEAFTRFGLRYELFAASMSRSDHIVFNDSFTSGRPRLAGFHLEAEPAEGWSIGVSRLEQYGGGLRGGGSLSTLFKAFFNPSGFDNTSPTLTSDQQAGNQEASFTSSFLFQGTVPFAVYFEYGGEDTSKGKNYLLGNTALSAGIHFPRLWQRFDLTVEASEWQNTWYVHNVYLDGMTNYGRVTGHWFGDEREFNDGVGGRSGMVSLGYEPSFGGWFRLRYRTLQNEHYGAYPDYRHFQDVSLEYSRPWSGVVVGGSIDAGRDVFGGNFTRLAGFVRLNENGGGLGSSIVEAMSADAQPTEKNGELFFDTGVNAGSESQSLTPTEHRQTGTDIGYHVALGARRMVSDHSDLGARIEADNVQGHSLIGVRALDYRYRFRGPLALSVFVGAARYNLATPAYGVYLGSGLQWRDVIPGWDVGVDVRYAWNIQRDHLLPNDPPNVGARNDSFYNVLTPTLFVSKHF
jgi:Capsule assembly protein Wzi